MLFACDVSYIFSTDVTFKTLLRISYHLTSLTFDAALSNTSSGNYNSLKENLNITVLVFFN